MTIFWSILLNNVLPLSVMIALGITLQRAFSLDIKTLSKLNFYLFSPAVIFRLLYTTELTLQVVGRVLLFLAVFIILLYGAVEAVVRIRGYEGGMRATMRNSVLFYNSANYGIPLNQLAFAGNPFTLIRAASYYGYAIAITQYIRHIQHKCPSGQQQRGAAYDRFDACHLCDSSCFTAAWLQHSDSGLSGNACRLCGRCFFRYCACDAGCPTGQYEVVGSKLVDDRCAPLVRVKASDRTAACRIDRMGDGPEHRNRQHDGESIDCVLSRSYFSLQRSARG